MVMGDAGYCACGCGCLRGLRHANLQGSKEEPQQKNGGSYRRSSVCGRCFGSHCDCPDSDAALIKRDEPLQMRVCETFSVNS